MVRIDRVSLVLAILLAFTITVMGWEGYQLYRNWRYNQLLSKSEASAETDSRLVAAYANHMARTGHWQQAVQLYTRALPAAQGKLREKMHYNLGTLYLREAARRWHRSGVWDYARVVTLLGLAREHLKAAVRLDPGDLQARYNLEYALAIQPPPREHQPATRWQGHKQSVFATLPGLPKGGP